MKIIKFVIKWLQNVDLPNEISIKCGEQQHMHVLSLCLYHSLSSTP